MGNNGTYERVTDPRDPLTITNNTDYTIQLAVLCVRVNRPVDGLHSSEWYNSCYTLAVGESVTFEAWVNYPVHLKISGGISRFMVTNLDIRVPKKGSHIGITEGDMNFVLTKVTVGERHSAYLYYHCVPCSCCACSCCACGIEYWYGLPLPCCIIDLCMYSI